MKVKIFILATVSMMVLWSNGLLAEIAANQTVTIEIKDVKEKQEQGFVPMVIEDINKKEQPKTLYVSSASSLGLNDISNMRVYYESWTDKPALEIIFNQNGQEKLKGYTEKHFNENFGVVINGKLKSVSRIRSRIDTGRISVGPKFTNLELFDLLRNFFLIKEQHGQDKKK